MRFLAQCPCPTCLVQKKQIPLMGTKRDAINCRKKRVDDEDTRSMIAMVRGWIFEKGYRIGSQFVNLALGSLSLVPTQVRMTSLVQSSTIA